MSPYTRPARVKRLTWYILVDALAEAWDRHDLTLLTAVYRATATASDVGA